MERIYNRGTKCSEIESGEWVWLRNGARPHSLSPMFRGPWLVAERRGVNLKLTDSDGNKTHTVHLNRCKLASHVCPSNWNWKISSNTPKGGTTETFLNLKAILHLNGGGRVSENGRGDPTRRRFCLRAEWRIGRRSYSQETD